MIKKNHFVSVAGIVTNDKNEVVLVKHPQRGWEFPGGMVEPGETLQEALKREILEESGVNVDIVGFIGLCKNIQLDSVSIDFSCRYISGELTPSNESLEVRWFPIDEVVEMMENPLYEKRMKNMVSQSSKMHCMAFTKRPFEFVVDDELSVGL